MKKPLLMALPVTAVLAGCTHANVSQIPQIVDGREVYTYTGRANFGHQMAVADKEMIKHCDSKGGKVPRVLDRTTQDLGYVVSVSQGSGSASGNQNQVIRFTCE